MTEFNIHSSESNKINLPNHKRLAQAIHQELGIAGESFPRYMAQPFKTFNPVIDSALKSRNIKTYDDLTKTTKLCLSSLHNIGTKKVDALQQQLREQGGWLLDDYEDADRIAARIVIGRAYHKEPVPTAMSATDEKHAIPLALKERVTQKLREMIGTKEELFFTPLKHLAGKQFETPEGTTTYRLDSHIAELKCYGDLTLFCDVAMADEDSLRNRISENEIYADLEREMKDCGFELGMQQKAEQAVKGEMENETLAEQQKKWREKLGYPA